MEKVFVSLSGGVDSSVAAWLLKKAGYQVTGVFMRFWRDPGFARENVCCSLEFERRARAVAVNLKIPFLIFDLRQEFRKRVVKYFLEQTKKGLTPNPCVICNQEIKFGLFLDKAIKRGADYIATGHYVRLRREVPSSKFQVPKIVLLKAKNAEKDQSYFLWRLNQRQLKRVVFPIGDYSKPTVREIAKKFGLPTAQAPESQDLCFLASDHSQFLGSNLKQKSGKVINIKTKKVIGQHSGLGFYTLGQSHGLGPVIFSQYQAKGPFYVFRKEAKKNQLLITTDKKDLLTKKFFVNQVNWLNGIKPKLPIKAMIKIRARQKESSAKISLGRKSNELLVCFNQPQIAITPGQSAVFYQGNQVLGGGIII